MNKFATAMRTVAPAAMIETISMRDLAMEVNPVSVRLVHDAKNGVDRLHLVAANDEYLSIKLGPKVALEAEDTTERIAELVSNYVVYTGTTDNGLWFTFGPEPTLTETKSVSFADLMKAAGIKNLKLQGGKLVAA